MSDVKFTPGDRVYHAELENRGQVLDVYADETVRVQFEKPIKGTPDRYMWNCWPQDLTILDPWDTRHEVAPPVKEPKTEAQVRKGQPVATGVLAYFPDALIAIAEVSKVGNDQHNPGQPLHWARGKSVDQTDALARHLLNYLSGEPYDTDGQPHLAKVAWRALAELQLFMESKKEQDNG